MELIPKFFLLFFAFAGLSAASSVISDYVSTAHGSGERSLLQSPTHNRCPVNFESMDYTVFTSKCRAPTYPVIQCCIAFQEFACPYAAVLNDLTNDCATTMFSYINLHGKYPDGLFAKECSDYVGGAHCPDDGPSAISKNHDLVITITVTLPHHNMSLPFIHEQYN